MSGFWKKKVPAFLLALVMVVGMVPAAMATEVTPDHNGENHNSWSEWRDAGNGKHYRKCEVLDCTAQEIEEHTYDGYVNNADTHWQECTRCEAKTTPEAHTPGETWRTNSSDPDNHWKECTSCNRKVEIGGHVDQSPVDGKCDTCDASVHKHSY